MSDDTETATIPCTGSWDCGTKVHAHGCLSDFGSCTSPEEHTKAFDRLMSHEWKEDTDNE